MDIRTCRQTHRWTDRQINRHIDIETDKQIGRNTNKRSERQIYRQIVRNAERYRHTPQTVGQRDRQTDEYRQID